MTPIQVPLDLRIVPLLISLIFLCVPPKYLIRWDRKSAYARYEKVLRVTQDEKKALRAAGSIYKIFGFILFFLGLLFNVVAILLDIL
jgi:hypothetical protein